MAYLIDQTNYFGNILEKLADKIDLTPTQYQQAIDRYEAVGNFLSQPGTALAAFQPTIISQGSFRIGTMNRPVKDEEFDVDATCKLKGGTPGKQVDLKKLIGDRFKSDQTYAKMLSEMRRCWRLHYADSARFHLDIVPAFPDAYQWLISQGVPHKQAQHALVITDNEHHQYYNYSSDWPKSNPEGYALWFIETMKKNAHKFGAILNKALMEHVEELPHFDVRTPLQRAVQLMKRHKEELYANDDDKPVSIIITTLAAKAYLDVVNALEPLSFYDILTRLVPAMRTHITNRMGVRWVANPVNPLENFADKWKEKPRKEAIFMKWLNEFDALLHNTTLNEGQHVLADQLRKSFGGRAVNEAFDSIGDTTRFTREQGNLKITKAGIIGAVGQAVKNHTFDGKK